MIRVRELTKRFGSVVAVDNLTFDVGRGQVFALLGPNGAGKTTTIQMLTTLLRPTSGTISINGIDPQKDPLQVRRLFGIVFQDPTLDDQLTAYENLDIHGVLYQVPRKVRAERIERLLKLFALWERRAARVNTFSGGMRRRLEIARSMLHTPMILFLDEPTMGLDPQSRNQLWNHVRELNQREQVTIFMTTHYLHEAEQVASRIAIVDRGKIAAEGSVQELCRKTGTTSLEQAFLSVTGEDYRDEEGKADVIRNIALARAQGRR